jgi:hypothetical protein
MGERSSLLQEKPKSSNGGIFLPKGKNNYGSSENGNISVSLGDAVNKGAVDVLGLHKVIILLYLVLVLKYCTLKWIQFICDFFLLCVDIDL